MITAKFKNRKELGNFVKKDLSGTDIERTDTHIVLITMKEDFRFLDNCKNSKVIQ
jgi:Lrp/AsnC family leucine-responsive transcriptional regulator